jgi:putative colanic acid biosynthesis UDP-glucose lipid carrier transferase
MNFVRRDIDVAGAFALRSPEGTRSERKWPISYESVEIIAIAVDAAVIVAASTVTGVVYHYQAFGTSGDVVKYFGLAAVVATLFISLMRSKGMYRPNKLLILRTQIRKVCLYWVAVFALLAGAIFALKIGNELSRGANLVFAIVGLCALIAQRIYWVNLLTKGIIKRKFSGRKVILITDRQPADSDLPQFLTNLGFQLEDHFTLPPPAHGNRKRKEIISRAIASVRGSEIEEIVVGADLKDWRELRSLLAEMRVLPCPVNLIPVGAVSEVFKQPYHDLGSAVCIEVQRGPLTPFECALKRILDIVIGGVALIALLPLFAIVSIAIRLDSAGPVFFRQQRCGFNGRCFQIIKFRTMTVQEDGDAVMQAERWDNRVSRIGKWLRRTSIDELPQLVNVLQGNMSLVGPRPHAVAHDTQFDKVVRNYAFRHRVKPGLTGWAQVHGCRGPTPTAADIERRVDYDLWYVDNWSFGLDFFIMLQTVVEVLRARNAY